MSNQLPSPAPDMNPRWLEVTYGLVWRHDWIFLDQALSFQERLPAYRKGPRCRTVCIVCPVRSALPNDGIYRRSFTRRVVENSIHTPTLSQSPLGQDNGARN